MQIHPAGREYAYYGLRDLSADPPALEVSFDDEQTWQALPWWDGADDPSLFARVLTDLDLTQAEVDAGTARVARVLAAGPAATGNPAGTAVLASGRRFGTIRQVGQPEVLYRPAGAIDVQQ